MEKSKFIALINGGKIIELIDWADVSYIGRPAVYRFCNTLSPGFEFSKYYKGGFVENTYYDGMEEFSDDIPSIDELYLEFLRILGIIQKNYEGGIISADELAASLRII